MIARFPVAASLALALLSFGSVLAPSSDLSSSSPAFAQSKLRQLIDRLRHGAMPDGIAKSNGRIEATQVDIAAKYAGRIAQVLVNEGDDVTAGEVLARGSPRRNTRRSCAAPSPRC